MLKADHLESGYGDAKVLHDISLDVAPGEIVTLLGRNGAGKTTLLRTIMGLNRVWSGSLEFGGRPMQTLPPHVRSRMGIGWVPDDRGIFASLSVQENLTLSPVVSAGAWSLQKIYEHFPVLQERSRQWAASLSGGEKQMLALARVLRMGTRLMLCDEPSEGLAPVIVETIGEILKAVREEGVSILLVEQNLALASEVADRHYLISDGEITGELQRGEVLGQRSRLIEHLGI